MGLMLVVLLALAGCVDDQEMIFEADALRPPDTEALTAPVAEGFLYFFRDRDFRGNATQMPVLTDATPGQIQQLGDPADSMTSLRWNLPPGVLVVLYEDAEGRGNQMAIWGSGQVNSVSPWKFNDKVSRWAWYYIADEGQVKTAPVTLARGLSLRPPGASPTVTLPAGTIELYKDAGFKGTMTTVGPIDRFQQAEYHDPGRAADSMSSLRWNLPPGVVAVLYEDAGGLGRQLLIWGSGQFDSVSRFDFNDKVSRWAWYDIAAERQTVPVRYDDID
jgi:hypothetical protein